MTFLQPLALSFSGAIIAASLAFYVRARLDANAVRASELRIAYVHYVRFSQFLAAEVAFKSIAKSVTPAEVIAKLGMAGEYDASHEVAAAAAALIEEVVAKQDRPPESVFASALLVANLIDGLKAIRQTDEQLSKLPKASVGTHLHFQDLADQLIVVLKKWEFSLTSNNFKWATAEVLHDQWKLLVSISVVSREARATMLANRVVTEKEAYDILKRQVDYYATVIGSQFQDGAKLGLAREAIKRRGSATS